MFLNLGCAQALFGPARKIVGLVECFQAGRAILGGNLARDVPEEGSTVFS